MGTARPWEFYPDDGRITWEGGGLDLHQLTLATLFSRLHQVYPHKVHAAALSHALWPSNMADSDLPTDQAATLHAHMARLRRALDLAVAPCLLPHADDFGYWLEIRNGQDHRSGRAAMRRPDPD